MTQLAVLVAALAVVVAGGAAGGNGRTWAYAAVVTTLVGIVGAAHRVARFSPGLRWALTAGALLHLAGGLVPGPADAAILYDAWLLDGVVRFDQAVHLYGSVVATLASWQFVEALGVPTPEAGIRAVVGGLMALGLGALVEVFEFLASHRPQGAFVGGFDNMGWDLVFDLAGVLAALAWLVTTGPGAAPPSPLPTGTVRSARRGRGTGSAAGAGPRSGRCDGPVESAQIARRSANDVTSTSEVSPALTMSPPSITA